MLGETYCDIADRGLGRLSWAGSAPTGVTSRRTGIRAIADPLGIMRTSSRITWGSRVLNFVCDARRPPRRSTRSVQEADITVGQWSTVVPGCTGAGWGDAKAK